MSTNKSTKESLSGQWQSGISPDHSAPRGTVLAHCSCSNNLEPEAQEKHQVAAASSSLPNKEQCQIPSKVSYEKKEEETMNAHQSLTEGMDEMNLHDIMHLQPTMNIGTIGHVAHGKSVN